MFIKQFLVMTTMLLPCTSAWANDSGISGVRVNDIRMREYEIKKGEPQEKRRIVNPNFKVTLNGGEARQLQKYLPSTFSVITSMQPELKDLYNESFKGLAIYNNKTSSTSSKLISINCNDAKIETDAKGKLKIIKTGASACEISIQGVEGEDMMGDIIPFDPGSMCRKP